MSNPGGAAAPADVDDELYKLLDDAAVALSDKEREEEGQKQEQQEEVSSVSPRKGARGLDQAVAAGEEIVRKVEYEEQEDVPIWQDPGSGSSRRSRSSSCSSRSSRAKAGSPVESDRDYEERLRHLQSQKFKEQLNLPDLPELEILPHAQQPAPQLPEIPILPELQLRPVAAAAPEKPGKKSPLKGVTKSPLKAAANKSPLKSPRKSPRKSPGKSPRKGVIKSPGKGVRNLKALFEKPEEPVEEVKSPEKKVAGKRRVCHPPPEGDDYRPSSTDPRSEKQQRANTPGALPTDLESEEAPEEEPLESEDAAEKAKAGEEEEDSSYYGDAMTVGKGRPSLHLNYVSSMLLNRMQEVTIIMIICRKGCYHLAPKLEGFRGLKLNLNSVGVTWVG